MGVGVLGDIGRRLCFFEALEAEEAEPEAEEPRELLSRSTDLESLCRRTLDLRGFLDAVASASICLR